MIRAAFALFGALLLASCGTADEISPPPGSGPALWEVTGKDGAQAYLFGTVHALPDNVNWRGAAIDQALAGSDLLVVEIADLGNAAAARTALDELAHSPGLLPLSQRVAAEERPALAALLQDASTSESQFAGVESWAAALSLASAVRDSDTGNGVDLALLSGSLPVQGLETFRRQFGIFDRLAEDDQIDLLMGVAEEHRQDDADIYKIWLSGDITAMEAEFSRGIMADPELREALLVARNRDWIEQLVPLMGNGRRPFVAVGAAHVIGADGLPEMFAKRGYSVTRLQ